MAQTFSTPIYQKPAYWSVIFIPGQWKEWHRSCSQRFLPAASLLPILLPCRDWSRKQYVSQVTYTEPLSISIESHNYPVVVKKEEAKLPPFLQWVNLAQGNPVLSPAPAIHFQMLRGAADTAFAATGLFPGHPALALPVGQHATHGVG